MGVRSNAVAEPRFPVGSTWQPGPVRSRSGDQVLQVRIGNQGVCAQRMVSCSRASVSTATTARTDGGHHTAVCPWAARSPPVVRESQSLDNPQVSWRCIPPHRYSRAKVEVVQARFCALGCDLVGLQHITGSLGSAEQRPRPAPSCARFDVTTETSVGSPFTVHRSQDKVCREAGRVSPVGCVSLHTVRTGAYGAHS